MRTFAVEKGGATIGVLPIVLERRGPASVSNYLPVPHVGPLLRDEMHLTDVLAAAEPYLRRQLTVAKMWAFGPGAPVATDQLARLGYHVRVDESFVVAAGRSPADHLAAMSRQRRRDIRLEQERGVTAGPADTREIREWFAERVAATYERQGVAPLYSRDACRMLVDLLGSDSRMLWRSVRDGDGQLIAVKVGIIDVDRLWAWQIAGDDRARPSPHLMAYWDDIEWSLSRNLSCDFGGSPNPGIRAFKLRMGVTSEPCLIAEGGSKYYRKLRAAKSRIDQRRFIAKGGAN
jgi:CelD/BcsL family acetyltransferase involved in cellulose biosynthesis